ncbi:MAG TPA: alcohol dehydrogenase catalytic domain-containing protein [Beijerinckiaceae bacterium]|nr:alcohol dehydrogenase catalytic domain-containing protein [Beijerinckiaceae bacterium]
MPEPAAPATGEVLLRVREVGICGTDVELAAFRLGYPPPGCDYMIPGHEAVAEVVAAGAGPLRVGDLVVPWVRRACPPSCRQCARGRRDLCLSGLYTERGILGAHGYLAPLAADAAADLVAIPPALASVAVLIEPLSVVEKAIATGFRLALEAPRRALIVGAGTIGILAALALVHRDLEVAVLSREASDSRRARLVRAAGAQYRSGAGAEYDLVLEAAGTPEAATAAVRALAPCGVLVVLGAATVTPGFPLLNLIVHNQVVAGSVNASASDFAAAVDDLGRFPRALLGQMIDRRSLRAFDSLAPPPAGGAPKRVYAID